MRLAWGHEVLLEDTLPPRGASRKPVAWAIRPVTTVRGCSDSASGVAGTRVLEPKTLLSLVKNHSFSRLRRTGAGVLGGSE